MNKKSMMMLFAGLFILWVSMIFYFSSQPPDISHSQSKRAVKIIGTINEIFDITDTKLYTKIENQVKSFWFTNRYKTTHAVVRKSAHFGIYFLFGMISCAFGFIYTNKILIAFLMGINLPVTIAVLDEFNQGFVGRTSTLNDVIIDGAGAFSGTVVVMFLILVIKIINYFSQYLKRIF